MTINTQSAISALAVANAFLTVARKAGKPLTCLQLQKLVYISQGIALARLGRQMYHNDAEAWKFGPVIPELFNALRRYAPQDVPNYPIKADGAVAENSPEFRIVERVYQKLHDKSSHELIEFTHEDDSPWAITRSQDRIVISKSLIRERYEDWYPPHKNNTGNINNPGNDKTDSPPMF